MAKAKKPAWGKECRCGQRIPKDWMRCGECEGARKRVQYTHLVDGRQVQELRQALARLRAKAQGPEYTETDRIAEQARILESRQRREQQLAERLPKILTDWYAESDDD